MDAEKRIAELEAEVRRLSAELESARARDHVRVGALNAVVRDLSLNTTLIAQAKEEWEAIIDAIPNPLFTHDENLRVLRCNRAFKELVGQDYKEIMGRPYHELFRGLDGPFPFGSREAGQRHERASDEIELLWLDRVFRVRRYPSIFPSQEGSPVKKSTLCIMEEITEERRAKLALLESEERFRNVSATARDAIVIIDDRGTITFWNEASRRLFGYTEEEAVGRELHRLIAPDRHHTAIYKGLEAFRRTGEGPVIGRTLETTGLHKDGEEVPVELSISAVKLGGKWCATGILRDITERKRTEEALKLEADINRRLLEIAESSSDMEQLLAKVVVTVRDILGADACLAYLWDDERSVFRPARECGLPAELAPSFRFNHPDADIPLARRLMELSSCVVLESRDEELLAFPPLKPLEGKCRAAAIPLHGRDRLLGFLLGVYTGDCDARPITDRERRLMDGVAHQVSISLMEAMEYKSALDKTMTLSRKIETIQVMHEIDRSILSTLDPREILESVAAMMARVVPCDRATIALVDRERGGFVYEAGFGLKGLKKGDFVPFADTSTTDVVETGRPQYTADLREDEDNLAALERMLLDEGMLSHIRTPLIIKEEVAGVLTVGCRRPAAYTPEDLSTVEKLASQVGLALSNARLVKDLEELFLGTVKTLSEAIDTKSPWTKGHSDRVTRMAIEIGRVLGLDDDELSDLELAGLLHDIGKLATKEYILDKPAGLTEEELNMIRLHPVQGARILAPIKQLTRIIPAIRHHHEFFDGNGYPDGLKDGEIPLLARILTVADTVDAMGADRPYRKGRPRDEIILELKRCSGTQFDPEVVRAFLSISSTVMDF